MVQLSSSQGVALTVDGVAQVKVIKTGDLLKTACEQFLGQDIEDIKDVLQQTLEGHLRAILGSLTVEQVGPCVDLNCRTICRRTKCRKSCLLLKIKK